MPSYPGSQVRSIYPGDSIALVNNAAVDTNVTATVQVSLAAMQGLPNNTLSLVNTTNQTATVQVAYADAAANYQPLKNADTTNAITVANGSAIVFTSIGPWLRCTFASAPTSGSLVISR